MTAFEFVGAAVVLYLLLLARSAWKQGELGAFLRSLLFVTALLGALVGIVFVIITLDRGW